MGDLAHHPNCPPMSILSRFSLHTLRCLPLRRALQPRAPQRYQCTSVYVAGNSVQNFQYRAGHTCCLHLQKCCRLLLQQVYSYGHWRLPLPVRCLNVKNTMKQQRVLSHIVKPSQAAVARNIISNVVVLRARDALFPLPLTLSGKRTVERRALRWATARLRAHERPGGMRECCQI